MFRGSGPGYYIQVNGAQRLYQGIPPVQGVTSKYTGGRLTFI